MKFAAVSASASGDNEIVAGVNGKRIRLLSGLLSFSGTVNAKWRSGTTDVSGLYYGTLGPPFPFQPGPIGPGGRTPHLQTAPGEALNLNLSGATAVGGHIVYEEVP